MTDNPIVISQGDSTGLISVRPDLLDGVTIDDNWICKTVIADADGTPISTPRVITEKTDDDLYFIVGLEPSETEQVIVSKKSKVCKWVIQLSNKTLVPAYNREKAIMLVVMKQSIT